MKGIIIVAVGLLLTGGVFANDISVILVDDHVQKCSVSSFDEGLDHVFIIDKGIINEPTLLVGIMPSKLMVIYSVSLPANASLKYRYARGRGRSELIQWCN